MDNHYASQLVESVDKLTEIVKCLIVAYKQSNNITPEASEHLTQQCIDIEDMLDCVRTFILLS